ncbi:UNVERIFIED_CONTAM: hypothetical protein Sradi_4834600 [Sesamum radiatum]|uniref:Uncharacterized protein n=1 Tax=Sesamum radiatum TaxID=300843 RepID=A0AAW2MWX7_SESRA
MGAPTQEQAGISFTEGVMADKLLVNSCTPAIVEYDGTTDPQEHLSHLENTALLHQYTDGIKCRVFVTMFAQAAQQCSRKHRKTELSLFSIHQKEGEPQKSTSSVSTWSPWKFHQRPWKLRPAPLYKDCWMETSSSPWLRNQPPNLTLSRSVQVLPWEICKLCPVQAPKLSSAEASKPCFRRTSYSSSREVPKSCSKEAPPSNKPSFYEAQ